MTERRFVLVDFRYTSDVVGRIRLYEAGNNYDMPRGSSPCRRQPRAGRHRVAHRLGAAEHPKTARGADRSGAG